MTIDDITRWFRGDLLEAVLIVLGAVLLTRFVRWGAELLFEHAQHITDDVAVDDLAAAEARKHRGALAQVLAWSASFVVFTAAGLLVLDRLNIPLGSMVAPATVIGAALGFGAQNIVRDLLSGFFIFAERQYGYGDEVRVSSPGETAGITGMVEEVTLRTTKLRTNDGELVVLPNGEIRQVTNLSKNWARVVLDIPVAADADISLATTVLEKLSAEFALDERWAPLLLEGPTVMGVQRLAVGYIQIRVVARTLPGRQWEVGRELRGRVAGGFARAGISSPSPIMAQGVGDL